MFLRNCWYVAAWGSEVGRAPLARTFLNQPVLLYRTEAGRAIAFEDRCCHRNLPLSMGQLEGDFIRCGYHGLKFDSTGACVEVPGQANVPPEARVRTYPLIEKWGLVWIWTGDTARVDESLLPHWQWLEEPGWAVARGNDAKPLPMKCNWQLNNDNLLDLSHVVYVHAKTLGGASLDRYPVKTERLPRSIRMMRWIPDVPPIPLWAKYLNYAGNVDRWQGGEIEIPTHSTTDVGFAPVGTLKPDGDRDKAIALKALITATPETETSSFMFYAQVRNFAVDDAEMTRHFVVDGRAIFLEDIAVMEAQQRRRMAKPGAPTIDISADAPHLAMRRLLEQLICAEV
jgi:phenylpropionate dioxygenase-like ring-hydroxylating dioxygenase large terminal subunit